MAPNVWRQRREDMMREAEQYRLAGALRLERFLRSNHTFLLTWELKRIAGLLFKLFRSMNKPRNGVHP